MSVDLIQVPEIGVAKPQATRESQIAECQYEISMSHYDSTAGQSADSNLDSADPDWCGRESTSPVLNRSNWHPSVNGGTFEAFSRLDSHKIHNEVCVRESSAIISKAVHGGCL